MDRRAKTDIKPLPFSAGENNDVDYNDYDKIRKVLPVRETRSCYIGARTLSTEMSCPICLDLLSQTMTAKECLHRFCSECITMALQRGNKECPTCRKKLVSKRSLRPDPNFDLLISRVWPDRSLYDNLQLHDVDNGTPTSSSTLMTSIEEGMKEQVNKRKRDQGLPDNDKKPKKAKSEDEDFPEINDDDVDDNEENLHDDFEANEEDAVYEGVGDVEFKNIEAFDDMTPHGEEVDGVMRMSDPTLNTDEEGCNDWDGYDEYDAYDMNGLTTEQQDELQADLEELDVLEYDSYESDYTDEDDEEGCEDEEDDTEDFPGDDGDGASSPGNDGDDLTGDDSQDMPDDDPTDDVIEDSKVADNGDSNSPDDTNTETTEPAVQCDGNPIRPSREASLLEPLNGSNNGINNEVRQSTVITSVPEFNTDYEEKFESISPPEMENGDSNETDPQDGNEGQEGSEDDSDSTTTTYSSSGFTSTTSGESSSISIIFSDDDEELNMNVMFPAELPMADVETSSAIPGCSGLGNLSASMSVLPGSSSANLPGSCIIAGPSSSMAAGPSSNSSTIAGPSSVAHGSSPGLSANSGSLIKLPPTSLSALAEELPPFRDPDAIERVPEGSADEVRPPSNSIPPKDRLNHWLANSPSSPQSPVEDMAVMPERRADDVDMMEPAISGSEEMEAELLPALSLSARDCPEELLIPRYVRAKHDTKMEHLAEFIHQRAMEEAQSNQTDFDADPVPTIPKPKHFYVFSRNGGHHVKQIFLHETMTTASCAMTQGDHLIIFYDIASIELRGDRQSILTDVVPPHFLSLPTV